MASLPQVVIPRTCSIEFYNLLPPKKKSLSEEDLLAKIGESPKRALDFLAQAIQDTEWVERNCAFAKKVFKVLTIHVLTKKIAADLVFETIDNMVKFNFGNMKHVVDCEYIMKEDGREIRVSRLILMRQTTVLRNQWIGDPLFELVLSGQYNQVECLMRRHLSLSQYNRYHQALMTDDYSFMADDSPSAIWCFLRQAIDFGHQIIVDICEGFLVEWVNNLTAAFEYFHEANQLNLPRLSARCKEVVHNYRGLFKYDHESVIYVCRNEFGDENQLAIQSIRSFIEPAKDLSEEIRQAANTAPLYDLLTLTIKKPESFLPPELDNTEISQLKSMEVAYKPSTYGSYNKDHLSDEPVLFSEIKSLNFSNLPNSSTVKRIVQGMLSFTPTLKALSLDNALFVDEDFIEQIALLNLPLNALSLKNIKLSPETWIRLLYMYPKLNYLNLEGVTLHPGFLQTLLNFCQIKGLGLSHTKNIESFEKMSTGSFKHIQFLVLYDNQSLTRSDFVFLFKEATNLKALMAMNVKGFDVMDIPPLNEIMALGLSPSAFKSMDHVIRLVDMPFLKRVAINGFDMDAETKKLITEFMHRTKDKAVVRFVKPPP